ncbi:MAG: MFS transporter [Rikenellaceae bacterium]|jgi:predicted MFS family arabinose efflux permease|nr:MFS transporter [Rikenellaceae bacterium]
MTDRLRKKLSESAGARWTALALVSFTMLCGYFLTDVMAPLQTVAELPVQFGGLGWSGSDYGFFTSAYGWINIFLLMLIVGGIILDWMGVRFTGIMAATVMIGGIGLKYWAIMHDFGGQTFTFFGSVIVAKLLWAAVGYAIFGFGVEMAGITVTKALVRWFRGKEIALAMGLQVACARIGTGVALLGAPLMASIVYANAEKTAILSASVGSPVLVGLLAMCVGLMTYLVFAVMDKRLDREARDEAGASDEQFRAKDIFSIVAVRGFWLLALLCVLFYSAVFPFLKYAASLMTNKFGVSPDLAGAIPSILPFGTILLTPFFGNLYDRRGHGANIMIIGAVMLVAIHATFSLPGLSSWIVALGLMVLLGIAFSLVPSAMWPSVPKIIPERQLGTAYALIFWIQNWGLAGVPLLVGIVLERYCIVAPASAVVVDGVEKAVAAQYDYTLPMLIFTGFGALALIVSLLLRREDRIKGYGLQLPNIKK